jgi:transcriptional regulator with XRE-family HTH domain
MTTGGNLGPLSCGEKILILRTRKQWHQWELAEAVGISRDTVGVIERGQLRNPSGGIVQKVAEVLGVTTDFLLNPEQTFGQQ